MNAASINGAEMERIMERKRHSIWLKMTVFDHLFKMP